MRYRGIGVFVASWLLASAAVADIVQLKADHPDSYVVKKGDTLWDISGHFLSKPWLWPKLWHINPQIRDPHWIYPGDVPKLVWVNGEPRLVREGGTDRGNRSRVLAGGINDIGNNGPTVTPTSPYRRAAVTGADTCRGVYRRASAGRPGTANVDAARRTQPVRRYMANDGG